MALRKNYYIPLVVADIVADEKLRECSELAHGIYFRLILLLCKQPEYGALILTTEEITDKDMLLNFSDKLSKHMPFKPSNIKTGLAELKNKDVIQIESNRLSQKRMIEDNDKSKKRSEAGKIGGKSLQNKIQGEKGFTPPANTAKPYKKEEFDPKLAKERYGYFSEQLLWLQSVTKNNKLASVEVTKTKLLEFCELLNDQKLLKDKEDDDFQRHFVNWLRTGKVTGFKKEESVKSTIKIQS